MAGKDNEFVVSLEGGREGGREVGRERGGRVGRGGEGGILGREGRGGEGGILGSEGGRLGGGEGREGGRGEGREVGDGGWEGREEGMTYTYYKKKNYIETFYS